MLRLGVARHKESLYRVLRRFQKLGKSPIESKDFGFFPGVGRVPSIYYLTKFGAGLLAEYLGCYQSEINYPKGVKIFQRDYFHRLYTIDFHIALRQQAEKENSKIILFETYFDKVGSNRNGAFSQPLKAKTKINFPSSGEFFIPDIIFHSIPAEGKPSIYAVEIHNGKDTKRFLRQFETYVNALTEGVITEHFHLNIPARVAFVFEFDSAKKYAIQRAKQKKNIDAFYPYFSFNTIQNIQKDFSKGWEIL